MIKSLTQFWIVVVFLLATQAVSAQDIHFSQFYSSPVTLNPAMTGNVNGSYRISATYRNQWASISASPYSTAVLSIDASLFGCSLATDHVGVGLAVFNDRAGEGGLSNTTALASLAYHKGLDQDRRFLISVGGQVGFVQKRADIEKLCFQNQISNFECHNLFDDPNYIPNGEAIDNQQFNYLDFRVGGLLTAQASKNVNLYGGAGYYHASQPTETFLVSALNEAEQNKLGSRLVLHGGGSLKMGSALSFSPSFIFMNQSGVSTYVAGGALGYHFNQRSRYQRGGSNDNSALYLGGWYRDSDAVILLVGVDFQRFKLGFSYDINVSDLSVATSNQGGVELSLMFTGITSECNRRSPLYCPRF